MHKNHNDIFARAIRRRKYDELGVSRRKEVKDPITVEIDNKLDTARSHFRVDVANSGLIWSKRVYVDDTPRDQYGKPRVRSLGLYRHEYCYSMSDVRTGDHKEVIINLDDSWWMNK